MPIHYRQAISHYDHKYYHVLPELFRPFQQSDHNLPDNLRHAQSVTQKDG